MGEPVLPHVEYSSPYFTLPQPPTQPELIAAVMMTEGCLKAADLGVDLGERLTAVLYWMREPERLSLRLAQGDPGDPWAPKMEAMVQATGGGAEAGPRRRCGRRIAQAGNVALSYLRSGVRRIRRGSSPLTCRTATPDAPYSS